MGCKDGCKHFGGYDNTRNPPRPICNRGNEPCPADTTDGADWPVRIKTSRSNCINLINGQHGRRVKEPTYECDHLDNEAGFCIYEFCPLKVAKSEGE